MTLKQKFFLSLKLPSLFIQITRYITSIYTGKILMFVVSGTWMSSSLYHWWVELFVVKTIQQENEFSRMHVRFSQEVLITHFLFNSIWLGKFFLLTKHLGSWVLRLEIEYQMAWVYYILAHHSECFSTRSLLLPVYMALIHVSHHTNSPPFQTEILRSSFEPFSWIKTCAERGEVVQFWTA